MRYRKIGCFMEHTGIPAGAFRVAAVSARRAGIAGSFRPGRFEIGKAEYYIISMIIESGALIIVETN